MKTDQALIAFSRANARVKDLGNRIGDALSESSVRATNLGLPGNWLSLAYERTEGPGGEVLYLNHGGDIEHYLGERCMYALLAHQLIQERKAARKELGIAKRRVNMIANKLAAQADKAKTP